MSSSCSPVAWIPGCCSGAAHPRFTRPPIWGVSRLRASAGCLCSDLYLQLRLSSELSGCVSKHFLGLHPGHPESCTHSLPLPHAGSSPHSWRLPSSCQPSWELGSHSSPSSHWASHSAGLADFTSSISLNLLFLLCFLVLLSPLRPCKYAQIIYL